MPGTASSVRDRFDPWRQDLGAGRPQPRLELPCEAAPPLELPDGPPVGKRGGWPGSRMSRPPRRGLEAQRPAPLHSTPFLAPRSFLTAGVRPLYLAWQGGQPPYAVTLRAPDGHVLAAQAGLSVPQWQTPRLTLKAGRHQLEGDRCTGRVAAHDAAGRGGHAAAPPMPEGIQQLPIHEQRWLRLMCWKAGPVANGGWRPFSSWRLSGSAIRRSATGSANQSPPEGTRPHCRGPSWTPADRATPSLHRLPINFASCAARHRQAA